MPERELANPMTLAHPTLAQEHMLHDPLSSQPPAEAGPPGALALSEVVRQWRRVLYSAIAAAIITAVVVLVLPPRYESQVTVVPGGGSISAGGSLAGLAQGLGIGGLASALQGGGGLNYFSALVNSRSIAERVLLRPLPASIDPREQKANNLFEIYGADKNNYAYSFDRAIVKFEKALDVQTDASSGVLTVTMKAESPELARTVTRNVMEELDSLNRRINHQSAVGQLSSIENQLSMAQHAMYAAEDSLQSFLMNNRTYTGSPQLVFQESRLHRRVDIRQATVQALSQQAEQARLDANKSLPTFSVIDPPNLPTERSFPKRKLSVLIATVLGAFGAIAAIFCMTFVPAVLRANRSSPIHVVIEALQSDRASSSAVRHPTSARR